MKRGICFEIPNEYGSFLGEMLEPFDVTAFNWYIGDEESYFVDDNTLGESLFPEEINGMDGLLFKGIVENNKYYVIFANLKAYPKDKNVIDIGTYEDFLISDCQLVLLVVDCAYVTIYCKNKDILECLYQNAIRNGYDDVQFITDENDGRTRLSVW
ncbi:DUF2691 family protein [Paenibacillus radicis (ex Xue et al. 2023)]|uniref:DUF2691 family protein n=1 Tax=Paenibacillus radicis (ex Xue et al. 2023) TaxID=2972489 RepID=A0ABT1YJ65_9BACL|nr:DUF2691 family protein [Paenibacillus radicis (ex Xue et al. 2023)]MCR8632010.1 DUF2691 family protein [Paenibacillus radicis (ex Xue et al. 2023)]